MKQGWEIKKLGDVATILDSQRKPVTKKDRCNGIYPYYGASGVQDYVDKYIFDGRYLLVGEDGAKWGASDKSAYIVDGKCWVNNHAHILKLDNSINDKMVEYYLVYKDLSEYITGAIVPKLTQQALKQIPIPVPERAEQERIVGELDCLSGIIAAKRAQLRELDTLAQSIFYTMFGDPITNDKGWQTNALGDVCIVNPPKKDTLADVQSDDFVSFIPMEDLSVKAGYVKSKQQRLCKDVQSSYTCFADNDILMAKVTPCFENGKVGITQNLVNGIGFGSSEFIVIRPVNVIKEYVYFVIQTPIFIDEAVKRLTGTSGLRRVPRTYVEECIISIPPIDLQKQFAEKIENIERQKELITKSIKETEDLFNSRMDYYFN